MGKFDFSKSKTGAIAITLFLMFSMSASLVLVPTAKAATPTMTIPTFAYVSVSTNPVGTGQSVEIIMWLNQVIFNAAFGNNIRFANYQLSITGPSGSVVASQTFQTVNDPTSAQDYTFVPTTTGTYTINFTFPGQTYNFPITYTMFGSNAPYEGAYYGPSSASCTLTVQSTPIASYPTTPLPTSFWTRPIYGYNTNWYTVSSNWLGDLAPGYSGFEGTYNAGGNGEQLAGAGDVVGSMTSHVMWTTPMGPGGVVGGNQTSIVGDTYFEGSAYNQRYENPIIVDGILVYTNIVSFAGTPASLTGSAYGPTVGVDLTTGKQLWSNSNMPQISFASIYDVQDPNQHGVYPPILYAVSGGSSLFGTSPESWQAYDAFTGTYMFTVNGIPLAGSNTPHGIGTSTTALGPNGEYLIISLVNYGTVATPNWYVQEWNSSRLWDGDYSGESTSPPVIPPVSAANNVTGGIAAMYDFNVSVPFLDSSYGSAPVTAVWASQNSPGSSQGSVLLAYSGNLPSTGAIFMGSQSDTPYTYFEVNINEATPSSIGTTAWHTTLQPPPNNITVLEAGVDPVNGVFVENYRETSQYVGYSLATGDKLWGPTAPQASLDYYGSPASGSLANAFGYGNMYSSAYAGIVYCYDTKTGNLLWTYGNGVSDDNSTNSGLNTPFANYPTFVNAIGSGLVYLVTTEHTPETPLFKGGTASAINATTGKLVWAISDYTGEFETFSYAAADGYNTWFNGYDSQIYVVGRGPSKTTVTAPDAGLASGQPVVIQGTVTDISAGTQQTEQAADFPNGVPVASDASMQQWMAYVYQQQPEPTNFTGVPVSIYVLDSNHNYRQIGTATTNENGMYTLTWTPDISGNYTVYAIFGGTNGYYPSQDTASFTVMQPVAATPTATISTANLATTSDLAQYVAGAAIAIIIAIAIVGVVLARRKV